MAACAPHPYGRRNPAAAAKAASLARKPPIYCHLTSCRGKYCPLHWTLSFQGLYNELCRRFWTSALCAKCVSASSGVQWRGEVRRVCDPEGKRLRGGAVFTLEHAFRIAIRYVCFSAPTATRGLSALSKKALLTRNFSFFQSWKSFNGRKVNCFKAIFQDYYIASFSFYWETAADSWVLWKINVLNKKKEKEIFSIILSFSITFYSELHFVLLALRIRI